jgi:hypothetical protein
VALGIPALAVLEEVALNAPEIANKAAELVGGDRAEQHGDMESNFRFIAALWNAWLLDRIMPGRELTPEDIGQMMSLLKKARTKSGSKNPDDYVDDCGYVSCTGQIALKTFRR